MRINSPFPNYLNSAFKFSILTTASNETFTLPLLEGTHNFLVNWGDNSYNIITTYNDINITHTYAVAGTYIITMQGKCTQFSFDLGGAGDGVKLRQVLEFTDMGFTKLSFGSCNNLTSIANNMNVLKSLTTAYQMFINCSSLTAIPSGMFGGSVGITNFNRTFGGCALPSIPINLFRYNILATSFIETFSGNQNLQLNENIFWGVGERDTRFLNKSVNFMYCFYRASFSGIQGTAPDLWNCDFGSGVPTKSACFNGAGNSETSLTNYTSIPSGWK